MNNTIQKHTKFFEYNRKKIYYNYWSHTNSSAPDTIIFLGTIQSGKIPKWVAENAPPGVVVVEGIPHWEADPSAQDLHVFSNNYTESAFKSIVHTCKFDTVNIIAHSQAVPSIIIAAINNISLINNICLIAPLGFTTHIFGNTLQERVNRLRLRFLYTLFQESQSPFYDVRNIYNSLMLLKAILSETSIGASERKYAMGLSYDLRDTLRILTDKLKDKEKTLTIVLGEKDKIFPPDEVLESIKIADIKNLKTVVIPKLSHSSLALRRNSKLLHRIINNIRKKNITDY